MPNAFRYIMLDLWGKRTIHWKYMTLVLKTRKPYTVQKCLFHIPWGRGFDSKLGLNVLLNHKKDHQVPWKKKWMFHVPQGRSSDSKWGPNGQSMCTLCVKLLFTSANTEYILTSLYSSKKINKSMKGRRKNTLKRMEVVSIMNWYQRAEEYNNI